VHFDRKKFIYGLVFVAEIFCHVNGAILSIPGSIVAIMVVNKKPQAFQAKLETNNFATLSMLEDVLSQVESIRTKLYDPLCAQICAKTKLDCSSFSSIITQMQNHRQKVFSRGLFDCVGGIHNLKFSKTPLIYSVSYFNLGGTWSFAWGSMPTKAPPWRRNCSDDPNFEMWICNLADLHSISDDDLVKDNFIELTAT